jgi:hypothetical protein
MPSTSQSRLAILFLVCDDLVIEQRSNLLEQIQMKTSKPTLAGLLIAVLIGFAHSANADAITLNSTFAFEGLITGFSSFQVTFDGVSGPLETRDGRVLSIAPGDPFSGILQFFSVSDSEPFPFIGTFSITVRGENFGTAGLETRPSGEQPNAIGIRSTGGIGTSPYDLVDVHAHAEFLTTRSVAFPTEVPSIEDFLGTGIIDIDGEIPNNPGVEFGGFGLTGNITNVRAVPEPGPGMLLTAVVLASLFVARQRLGQARH